MKKKYSPLIRLLFLAYCGCMLWLLLGQRMGAYAGQTYIQVLEQNLNLKFFKTIQRYLFVLQHNLGPVLMQQAVINLAGNVVLFVPLGVLLPCIWKKQRQLWRLLLTTTALIAAVEVLQFFTFLGCCDVDDLLLNTLGVILGFFIWRLTAGKQKMRQ